MKNTQYDDIAGRQHALRLLARLERKLAMHEKYGISNPPVIDLAHELIMLVEAMGEYPAPYGLAVVALLEHTTNYSKGFIHSERRLFYLAINHALSHHQRYHGPRHDERLRKGGKGSCLYCFHIHNPNT